MKCFGEKITLAHNSRGIWDLDTFKGCVNGGGGGCYGICYAARLATARGYDYSRVVKRDFVNNTHFREVIHKVRSRPFIRIGVMGDPSYDWNHTLNIVDRIRPYNHDIVIITRHFNEFSYDQLDRLRGLVINTSISALDAEPHRKRMLEQYIRLKKYCKSVLRVNTADFVDKDLKLIQDELISYDNVIDNVLRVPKGHSLVKGGIINIAKYTFLTRDIYASKHSDNIFFGYCNDCLDKCGIESKQKMLSYYNV